MLEFPTTPSPIGAGGKNDSDSRRYHNEMFPNLNRNQSKQIPVFPNNYLIGGQICLVMARMRER